RGILSPQIRITFDNHAFSPMAHPSGGVIDTDTLIFVVSHVSSDGQQHEQDSEDNPNVNAHQAGLPPFSPPEIGSPTGGPTPASPSRVPPFDGQCSRSEVWPPAARRIYERAGFKLVASVTARSPRKRDTKKAPEVAL